MNEHVMFTAPIGDGRSTSPPTRARGPLCKGFSLLLFPIVLCATSLYPEPASGSPITSTFPGKTWEFKKPADVGLRLSKLEAISKYLGGRGCVVRYGYMAYTWGDYKRRGDVASACKPVFAHFLFKAVEDGRISSLDEKVCKWEPRLLHINKKLGYKDRQITFRHMANQTSCYGVVEKPGSAFDYNDWQMALFWDILFLKVYGATFDTVDEKVLHPLLTDPIQCEDNPTFMAFGTKDRPGRLGISPRDFARLGLLYLNRGNWNGKRLISERFARMAVTSPLPASLPRAGFKAAEMIPGQRSLGSRAVPDNQTDHYGSYSWLWWVNGVDRRGKRLWPDAPTDVFAALGHKNGKRGMAVMPGLAIVISWNDTTLDSRPSEPHPLNEVFRLLVEATK